MGKCARRACRSGPAAYRWQVFADGTVHLREECARCGRFRRYAAQTAVAAALAGERPEPGRNPDVPRLPPETRREAAAFRAEYDRRAG